MTTALRRLIDTLETDFQRLRLTHPRSLALADVINNLVWLVFYANPTRSHSLCEEVRAITTKHGDAHGYALCLRNEIELYSFAGDTATAWQRLYEMESVVTPLRDPYLSACLLEEWSYLHWLQGNFAQALLSAHDAQKHHAALALPPTLINIESQSRVLNLLGLNHSELGDDVAAIPYYDAALALYAEHDIGTTNQKALYYNNKAYSYCLIGDYEAALPMAAQSLRLCHELLADHVTIFTTPHVLDTLGTIYMALGDMETAAASLKEGLASNHRADGSMISVNAQSELYATMGQMARQQGDLPLSLHWLKNGLEAAQAANLQAKVVRYQLELSQTYRAMNDHATAYRYYQQYALAERATMRERYQQRLHYAQTMHTLRRTQAETELLQQKNQELAQKIQELEAARDHLQQVSVRDGLTGLYNRRFAEAQLVTTPPNDNPTTIAIIDIDDFKRVNDTYFHKVGDEVLRHGAELLERHLSKEEWAARYGGEEFLLLMQRPLHEAVYLCEQVRHTIESHTWGEIHPNLQVTVSIGLAALHTNTHPNDAVKLADHRMYKAKRRGKNCVVYD